MQLRLFALVAIVGGLAALAVGAPAVAGSNDNEEQDRAALQATGVISSIDVTATEGGSRTSGAEPLPAWRVERLRFPELYFVRLSRSPAIR
jgi:hypothetical protein